MDSVSVRKFIEREVDSMSPTELEFGHFRPNELRNYLVEPYEMEFYDPVHDVVERYWVILDEDAGSANMGYIIFFSVKDNEFGLATKTNLKQIIRAGTAVSYYGSFAEVLKSL
ncbi:MAG: hypothetical protein AB7Q37_14895 [Pyrinomonadaceae bacterium]